jgi:hypothetical protein
MSFVSLNKIHFITVNIQTVICNVKVITVKEYTFLSTFDLYKRQFGKQHVKFVACQSTSPEYLTH